MIETTLDKTAFAKPYFPMSSQGLMRFAVNTQDKFNAALRGNDPFARMIFAPPTQLAITAGALATPTQALHTVAAETGVSDELNSIPASNGRFVILKAAVGHTIIINHAVGNIYTTTTNTFTLTGNRVAMLWCIGGNWSITASKRPLNNTSAIVDPSTSNDISQNYNVGSFWINTALKRTWMCVDSATGAAQWQPVGKWLYDFKIQFLGATANPVRTNVTLISDSTSWVSGVDSTWPWVALVPNTSVIGDGGFARLNSTLGATFGMNPVYEAYFKTPTDLTNQRLWFGFTDIFANADAPTFASIALRYSSVAGDTGFVPYTHNGAGGSTTGTPIDTIQASTVYRVRIRCDSVNGRVYFSVNNSAEQIITTTLPLTSAQLTTTGGLIMTTTNKRTIFMGWFGARW